MLAPPRLRRSCPKHVVGLVYVETGIYIYIYLLGWDRDRDRENIYIGLEIGI